MTNRILTFMAQQQEACKKLEERFGKNYDKQSESFGLNVAEAATVREWYESLKPEIVAIQRGNRTMDPLGQVDSTGQPEPYYGAVGGGLTYSFTPTSLGYIITVKESITGKELNVSAALDWVFFG